MKVHETDGYPVEGVDDPEAWIRPPAVLSAWVAEEDGTIVGHVAVIRPQGEGQSACGGTRAGRVRSKSAFWRGSLSSVRPATTRVAND